MTTHDELPRRLRILSAMGAVFAAMAVGLAAYTAHAVDEAGRAALYTAAILAFGHGVALAALAPVAAARLRFLALCGLLAGTLLFSGSLVLHHALALPVRLAPLGGSVTIFSWLLYAAAVLRR